MSFQSCSQAGQDAFAYEMSGRKNVGWFLDIGSYNVVTCNNSFALERVGWRGLMVDLFRDDENLPKRTSPFLQANATSLDWLSELVLAGMPNTVDFLSLDVDADTLAALLAMPLNELKFNVACIEHDRYLRGDEPRDRIRFVMEEYGYDLVCADVVIPGFGEAEDWWAAPHLSEKANRFRSQGKPFTEFGNQDDSQAGGSCT